MCHLRPLDFVQKHPQNAQNAILENQISKNFRGGHAPIPLEMCRHFGLMRRFSGPLKINKILIWPSRKSI